MAERVDWQLRLFRFGLLACIAGVLFATTQFDITESVEAIWIGAPTTQEIVAESVAYEKRKTVCFSQHEKAKMAEYASRCYINQPNIPELARDVANANIVGFLVTVLALLAMLVAVGILGVRMGRDNGGRDAIQNKRSVL